MNTESGIVTLVAYSDLLGFGSLVSNSSGSLDTAVGKIALRRIEELRNAAHLIEGRFPAGTQMFHLNDTVVATLDVDISIGSMPVDPESFSVSNITRDQFMTVLRFVTASSALHELVISAEQRLQLGPAGRTFVVLGKRWQVPERKGKTIVQAVPVFHGNMALAEAYAADSLGSASGFDGSPWGRLYVNDFVWLTMLSSVGEVLPGMRNLLTAEERVALQSLGLSRNGFPHNLSAKPEVIVKIFHRKRRFYPLMSQHVVGIFDSLKMKAN